MRVVIQHSEQLAYIVQLSTGQTLNIPVKGVVTDNRECMAGDLYIALKGKRTDGHTFLSSVKKAGAAAALV
ncbi:MAG: Mur ligase domain-containing protein [Candidatus Neomarinimicrobiota bacterium]|nr:Mur ligase domain-containing protein [Candidatus Neomarinimicrobiota bacterium]